MPHCTYSRSVCSFLHLYAVRKKAFTDDFGEELAIWLVFRRKLIFEDVEFGPGYWPLFLRGEKGRRPNVVKRLWEAFHHFKMRLLSVRTHSLTLEKLELTKFNRGAQRMVDLLVLIGHDV